MKIFSAIDSENSFDIICVCSFEYAYYVASGGPPGTIIFLRGLLFLLRFAVKVAVRYSPI